MADGNLQVDHAGAHAMTGWLDSFGVHLMSSTDGLTGELTSFQGSGGASGAMLADVLDSHHEAMRTEAKNLHAAIGTTVANVSASVNVFTDRDEDIARGISGAVEGGERGSAV